MYTSVFVLFSSRMASYAACAMSSAPTNGIRPSPAPEKIAFLSRILCWNLVPRFSVSAIVSYSSPKQTTCEDLLTNEEGWAQDREFYTNILEVLMHFPIRPSSLVKSCPTTEDEPLCALGHSEVNERLHNRERISKNWRDEVYAINRRIDLKWDFEGALVEKVEFNGSVNKRLRGRARSRSNQEGVVRGMKEFCKP